MSVFSEIENNWQYDSKLESEMCKDLNWHEKAGTLIAIIKAAKQELQDMRDDYAPDQHPEVLWIEDMEDILEGKS